MSEREKLCVMLNRTNDLSDRLSDAICQRIATCKGLNELDELFALAERAHDLFRRIYRRYDATLES